MLQSRIRRGELDREITFIEKVIEDSSFNEDKEKGWTLLDTDPVMWARVVEKPGKEMMIADRLTYVQSTVFTCDYRSDVNNMMRILYKGKMYEISSITDNEGGRDRFIDITGNLLDTEDVNLIINT